MAGWDKRRSDGIWGRGGEMSYDGANEGMNVTADVVGDGAVEQLMLMSTPENAGSPIVINPELLWKWPGCEVMWRSALTSAEGGVCHRAI